MSRKLRGKSRGGFLGSDLLIRRAQEVGSGKLAGWREEDHEATGLLEGVVRGRCEETC